MSETVIPMHPGAEIITLSTPTRLDLPAVRVLQAALDKGLDGCVIVGYDQNGEEYFASTWADAAQAAWHLQRGIYRLNQMCDRLVEEGLPA